MKKLLLATVIFTAIAFVGSGCYNDKANELYPEGNCDTSNVTYSAVIGPIIQTNCAYSGCHSATNPAGNIPMNDYAAVLTVVNNGRLIGTMNHESGFSPMPQGGVKLSDCIINKVRIWVNNGAQNN